jgi:4a-hydroxytetrahydrobiopterin dehydratase
MAKLAEAEIASGLQTLSGWKREGETIVKTFEHESFMPAVTFVNKVAELAEAANHHPDITINYRRVHLLLTTHDSGGLTERDFKLAKEIDALK